MSNDGLSPLANKGIRLVTRKLTVGIVVVNQIITAIRLKSTSCANRT